VLLSAMVSKPDWLLTHNTKHFSMIGRATLANSVVWNARGCSRFRITRTNSVARIDVQS
jgi:hypothetical protein